MSSPIEERRDSRGDEREGQGRQKKMNVFPYIIIVQAIFHLLWDHCAHPGYFENRIPLKPVLRETNSNKSLTFFLNPS